MPRICTYSTPEWNRTITRERAYGEGRKHDDEEENMAQEKDNDEEEKNMTQKHEGRAHGPGHDNHLFINIKQN